MVQMGNRRIPSYSLALLIISCDCVVSLSHSYSPKHVETALDLRQLHRRLKRTANEDEVDLQYDIDMFGAQYQLQLRRSSVASEDFRAVFVDEEQNIKAVKLDADLIKSAHYIGSVNSCNRIGACHYGQAAMSRFSSGLRGVLKIGGEDILIEPLPETLLTKRMRFSSIHIAKKTAAATDVTMPTADATFLDSLARSLVVDNTRGTSIPSTSPQVLTIKVGVFLDRPMVLKLRTLYPDLNDQITLVLATYNAVNLLYNDASIGTVKVNQIVRQIVLDFSGKMPQNPKVTEYLNDLCTRYQREFLVKSGQTRDWQLTTALTGLDVYADADDVTRDAAYKNLRSSAKKVFTVSGVSFGGGMCSIDRNCMVAEFSLLFGNMETIAHETGHTLGMFHDGSGNKCDRVGNNIMSVQRPQRQRSGWSTCSGTSLYQFFASGRATCLLNEVENIYSAVLSARKKRHITSSKFELENQTLENFSKVRGVSMTIQSTTCPAKFTNRANSRTNLHAPSEGQKMQ